MLKEHDAIFRQLMIAVDLVLVALAFLIAHYFRNQFPFMMNPEVFVRIYPLETYLDILPFFVVFWGGTFYFSGVYRHFRGRELSDVLFDLFKAGLIATLLFGSYAYLFKLHYVSRTFIILSAFFAWFFLSVERIILVTSLRYIRKKGLNTRYLLIVGTGKRAQTLMHLLHQHPDWGFQIAGLIDDEPELVGKEVLGHKVLGRLNDMPALLEQTIVDEVIFVVPRSWLAKIEDAILYCEQVGKRVSIAVDLFTLKFAKSKQSGIHDFPLMMFQSTTDKLWQLLVKRLLDMIFSVIAIIILFPFLAAMALIIKLTSNGPVLFKQIRCSLNGRVFTVYKFRTMVVDAESRLEALRKHNEMTGPAFKMTDDPRIIKVGKWMRKFSIDELPQLYNILCGDMSFVGPRPPIPAEVKKYEPWQRRRLSMRPGLTCIWQIEGRNRIVKFNDWMKLDLQYIDNWSLWLDFKIFLKTIPIVIFGIGAK